MRFVAALLAATVTPAVAFACPGDLLSNEVSTESSPSTDTTPCMTGIDLSVVHRVFQIGYSIGVGGETRSGVGNAATAFAGLELAYGLAFGGDESQAAYEIEIRGGATGTRVGGVGESTASTTGLVTQLNGRLGPARMNASVVDEGKGNIAFFPLTMELAHVGELAARPQLAARPELARATYGRERVELSTRLVRVEGAGEKKQDVAPGMTEPKKPSAWALDFITLHGGVDVAMQDATRFESTIGGAMLGVVEHTTNTSADFFGIEHRRVDLMDEARSLDVVWMLKVDGVDPVTGSNYYMGWGEAISSFDNGALAERIDSESENPTLTIGGFGWYSNRAWGGFGAQYKREPFMTMTGELAIEDRLSAEAYLSKKIGLVGRVFYARTTQLVEDDLRHESTGGVAIDATYAGEGFSSKLALELGRTFYTALDGATPDDAGFAASLGLSIQHTGGRSWKR